MPHVPVNGFRLYYEDAGSGEPVVLIAGLGGDGHFWHKQIPALDARFRVITFDNRDCSRSDQVATAYTVAEMAGDVRALLDALEIESAHVVGASLGGFIAQQYALLFPARIRRLVLCCTSPGGRSAEPIPPETLAVLGTRTGDAARDLRAFLPVQFATDYLRTHEAEIDTYVAWRVAHPQSLPAYQRQLAAALTHDAGERLGGLRLPVLILHGGQDRVVPARNGELLAARIPGARLEMFPHAGHLFLWEAAAEANRLIVEFLSGRFDAEPTERRAGR